MLSIRKIQKLHLKHLKDAGKCTIAGKCKQSWQPNFHCWFFPGQKAATWDSLTLCFKVKMHQIVFIKWTFVTAWKKKIKKTFLVKQKDSQYFSKPSIGVCYKPRKVTSVCHACNKSVSICLCQQHFYLQNSKPNEVCYIYKKSRKMKNAQEP